MQSALPVHLFFRTIRGIGWIIYRLLRRAAGLLLAALVRASGVRGVETANPNLGPTQSLRKPGKLGKDNTMTAKPPTPVPRPRRWRLRFVVGVVILLVLVWMAPKIVAWTPLRNTILQSVFARLDGTIDAGSASLGWFAPVVLEDVAITAADGTKVLHVSRIESSRTLLGLLLDTRRLGSFRIERPELHLRAREQGSNLETVIAKYLSRRAEPTTGAAAPARHIELDVVDGVLHVHDEVAREQWRFAPVTAALRLAPATDPALRLQLQAKGGRDPTRGKLDVDLTSHGDRGACRFEGDDFPLAVLNPLFRRLGASIALSGGAEGKCTYRWSVAGGQARHELDGHVSGKVLSITGPWLAGERVRLEQVELPCRLAAVGSRLHLEEARLKCDLGEATLRGGVDLARPPADWLAEAGWSINADVDLARLANQLPGTLRLHSGTHVTSGRLKLACQSRADGDGVVWEGRLDTTGVEGRRAGKTLRWPEPVAVDFRTRRQGTRPAVLDRLRCESRFLRIHGSGSAEQLTVRADMDLKELAEPLSQFIDLGPFRLAGQGNAQLTIRALGNDAYAIESSGRFQNLHVVGLSEPSVDFKVSARVDHGDSLRLDRFYIECQALIVDGKGDVQHLAGRKDMDLQGTVLYDLERLEPHLRPYLGAGVKVVGRDVRPFRLTGPLASPSAPAVAALSGAAGLSWRSLRAYGAEVGAAELKMQLNKGWLHVRPIATTVNGGHLRLEPSVRLEPGPVELHLKPGRVLERANITPAMGASALAYALPVLAGVTEAEGQLSLQLDSARIPLAAPEQAEITGKLTVHAARLGGTPLVRELAGLFKVPPLSVQVRESVVPIRMAHGKVHHRDLDLIFSEMTVRTSGWVAVDGSLSLLAEMPIPPRWLGTSKLTAAVAKQRIQIPIRGTLDRPRLDEPALRDAMTRFLRDSAGNLLQQELENRLKKLMSK